MNTSEKAEICQQNSAPTSLCVSGSNGEQINKTRVQTIIDIVTEHKHPYPSPKTIEGARTYIAHSIETRQGQRKFRRDLLNAYGNTCLITGPNTEEILEAAHIRAYSAEGDSDISNGLLLRADIHTLFDLGLIAIDTKDMTVVIHDTLKSTSYRKYEGGHLFMSNKSHYKPDKKALDEHRNNSRIADR